MDNPAESGEAEPAKLDQENRKSHIRPADDEKELGAPNKVMKLQEGEDALTNQVNEEAELNDMQANDIDSDVDLGDDDEYEEEDELNDKQEGAEQKDMDGDDDEEQLDLEADDAGESDQAADFEGEDEFDEYEDELGTTAEETEDNVNEEEADSSTELQDFVQANLAYIEDCQSDIDTLNHKANEEILRVEQKYNKLRLPVYKRRNTYIERVPHFWATVFSQHSQLRQVLTKEDIKCLKYVTRLQVEDFEDNRSGYSIQFYFSENPWFENQVITKEYHLPWHGSPSCSCTPIGWKKRMDLTKKSSSFFSWFTSQEDASADDIAEIIKDDLWPNPLQCFLMSNKQPDDSDDDDEADDSGNLAKDDSVVLLDDINDDDVEYISSEEDEDEGDWEGKEQTTSARYLVQDEEEEDQDDEEYDDFDEDEGLGEVDVERTDESLQERKDQMRPKGEVITVDDDYLESDDEDETEYFDGTVDPDVDERLLGGQEVNEVEGSENEGEAPEEGGGDAPNEAKPAPEVEVQRADSSHDEGGTANEDSRHSNGVVGSSTHVPGDEDDKLDVAGSNGGTAAQNELENPPPKAGLSAKIQEQSKVVSTSTNEGEPDITAGAT